MKSVELFLPRVLPHVIGCPTPLAMQAVVDAAIEFCERTNAVQQQFVLASVANRAEYDIEVPQFMEVCRVLDLYYGTQKLTSNDLIDVDMPVALRGAVDEAEPEVGTPRAFFAPHGTNVFRVYPVPDRSVNAVITCRASFKPTPTATQLDDLLYSRYIGVITAGAVYRLVSLPDQPFSAPSVAKLHGTVFFSGVSRAIPDARKGAAVTSSRINPRAFA